MKQGDVKYILCNYNGSNEYFKKKGNEYGFSSIYLDRKEYVSKMEKNGAHKYTQMWPGL